METEKRYGNGMCFDCYSRCIEAENIVKQMNFEEGELSEEAWDKEYHRRLQR